MLLGREVQIKYSGSGSGPGTVKVQHEVPGSPGISLRLAEGWEDSEEMRTHRD